MNVSETDMNRREVIQMSDNKQSSCGCDCLPSAKKGSRTPMQEDKKPKK